MTEGTVVMVRGVVTYDDPGNSWAEVRFADGPAGSAIIPRSLLMPGKEGDPG